MLLTNVLFTTVFYTLFQNFDYFWPRKANLIMYFKIFGSLNLYLPDKTKKLVNFFNFQYKIYKSNTFFSNLKFCLFHDFLKLEFFPEKNPAQTLENSLGQCRSCQKFQGALTDLYFLTGNSQNFETEHKITVVDKTLLSNIAKL